MGMTNESIWNSWPGAGLEVGSTSRSTQIRDGSLTCLDNIVLFSSVGADCRLGPDEIILTH